jgi:hypothetical protein
MNLKNFGLKYYSDKTLVKTSFIATPAFFVMRFSIGAIIDNFGLRIVYKYIAGLTITTVVVFYFLIGNIWAFYGCVLFFYGLQACISTTITVGTSFIYGHEVGKRLQAYMHAAFD